MSDFETSNLHAPTCTCLRNLAKLSKPPWGPVGGRTPVSSSPPSLCVPCTTENSLGTQTPSLGLTFSASALKCHDEDYIKHQISKLVINPAFNVVCLLYSATLAASKSLKELVLLDWRFDLTASLKTRAMSKGPGFCFSADLLARTQWQAGYTLSSSWSPEGVFMIGCIIESELRN